MTTVESLEGRIEVLEKQTISNARLMLKLAETQGKMIEQNAETMKSLHLLLDKLGLKR